MESESRCFGFTLISSLIDDVLLPTPVPPLARAKLFQWINKNLRVYAGKHMTPPVYALQNNAL